MFTLDFLLNVSRVCKRFDSVFLYTIKIAYNDIFFDGLLQINIDHTIQMRFTVCTIFSYNTLTQLLQALQQHERTVSIFKGTVCCLTVCYEVIVCMAPTTGSEISNHSCSTCTDTRVHDIILFMLGLDHSDFM